ncbi:MAG TPA: 2Fe-2S iron-sulfur cluster-binding protein [Bryocella sp.]|nr:2Fe-2S iron-sulfur cluster-binding protein [Bryocella sp.]
MCKVIDELKNGGQPPEPEKETRVSRRSFLTGLGAASVAVTAQPLIAAVPGPAKQEEEAVAEPGTVPLTLRVNGVEHRLHVEPRVALLDYLRENLNLPGTKKGCDHGQCGACTVHVNGRRVLSCMSLAVMHAKDEITTIEGLGSPEKMHPMQASFVENDAYQCGYCTSGQIMSAVAVLKEPVGPDDDDVRNAMYGNICRCGAYPNIVAAVQQVRRMS